MFRTIDRSWHWIAFALGPIAAMAYVAADRATEGRFFFGTLDNSTRTSLYSSLAGSSAVLLGFVITALAILFALDRSREAVRDLTAIDAWKLLVAILFSAIAAIAATLVASTVALAIDTSPKPKTAIEVILFGALVPSVLALVLAGVAFGLAIRKVVKG